MRKKSKHFAVCFGEKCNYFAVCKRKSPLGALNFALIYWGVGYPRRVRPNAIPAGLRQDDNKIYNLP